MSDQTARTYYGSNIVRVSIHEIMCWQSRTMAHRICDSGLMRCDWIHQLPIGKNIPNPRLPCDARRETLIRDEESS